jgi:predicted dehydrogenase
MQTAAPIRTAVIGYGFSGRRIAAPLLSSLPEYELSALVARSEESRALAGNEHPDAVIVGSLDELLEQNDGFDLVVVGTPDDSHFDVAEKAIDAGLSVIVDKPLATSRADGRKLLDKAAERGTLLTAFQNKRWDSDYLTLQHLVQSGTLGPVTRYDAWIARWSPEIGSTWRERARPGTLDGRLADLGSHLVDQAVALLGPVSQVYAELDRRRAGARTNDDVFLALTHASGVRTHLHMGSVTSHLTPTFQVQGLAGSFVTHGLDGQFAALARGVGPLDADWRDYDTWYGDLVLGTDRQPYSVAPGDWRDFYRNVAEALRGDVALEVLPSTVLHVLGVLEAAVESDRTGAVVPVQSA